MQKINCWLCKVPITEDNRSGIRATGEYHNACIKCHTLYLLVNRFKKLPEEIQLSRVGEYTYRAEVMNYVIAYPNKTAADVARIVKEEL